MCIGKVNYSLGAVNIPNYFGYYATKITEEVTTLKVTSFTDYPILK